MPGNKLQWIARQALLTWLVLGGCSQQTVAPSTPEAFPSSQPGPLAAAAQEDQFEVIAWVDNETPAQGERVNLSGSLLKNGVFLGGMMMQAYWPDENLDEGMPNCNVLVIYQRGVCIIETGDFPVGDFVSITVEFEYNGKTHTGQTGFTPGPAEESPVETGG